MRLKGRLNDWEKLCTNVVFAMPGGPVSQPVYEALRDEMVTLLLAGHETTALSLAWVFHRLFMHPEVHRKVLDEIARVADGGAPEPEHMPRLDLRRINFIESKISETVETPCFHICVLK